MTDRTFPGSVHRTLKTSFRRLVDLMGKQESAASVTRVDYQRIGRYSRSYEALYPPIDVVLDIEGDAEAPLVTRTMADIQGYLLIKKPDVSGGPLDARALGSLAKEQGEALSKFGEALADGDVSKEEAPDLRAEILDALTELAKIDSALKAIEEADGE